MGIGGGDGSKREHTHKVEKKTTKVIIIRESEDTQTMYYERAGENPPLELVKQI